MPGEWRVDTEQPWRIITPSRRVIDAGWRVMFDGPIDRRSGSPAPRVLPRSRRPPR